MPAGVTYLAYSLLFLRMRRLYLLEYVQSELESLGQLPELIEPTFVACAVHAFQVTLDQA